MQYENKRNVSIDILNKYHEIFFHLKRTIYLIHFTKKSYNPPISSNLFKIKFVLIVTNFLMLSILNGILFVFK